MRAEEMINIGELMEIKIGDTFVKTKLQELFENGYFTVFHPTIKSIPVMLEKGSVFKFRFYRTNGIYAFDALLQDRYKVNEIMLCRFFPQSEVIKSQRRKSFRLPIVLDAWMHRTDVTDEEEKKPSKAKTVDISEYAVLLTSFAAFPLGTPVDIEIRMAYADNKTFKTKVLRCESPSNKEEPNRIVLLFVNSSVAQRDYLGRYILRQQIVARKKKKQEVEI